MAFMQRSVDGRTVNRLATEDYLKSLRALGDADVVGTGRLCGPRPSRRGRTLSGSRSAHASGGHGISDTTTCQLYKGYASRPRHRADPVRFLLGGHRRRATTVPHSNPEPYDSQVSANTWTKIIGSASTATVSGRDPRTWANEIQPLHRQGRDSVGLTESPTRLPEHRD
jgi:hypothetical protein